MIQCIHYTKNLINFTEIRTRDVEIVPESVVILTFDLLGYTRTHTTTAIRMGI